MADNDTDVEYCTTQCPDGQFGNHTTSTCQERKKTFLFDLYSCILQPGLYDCLIVLFFFFSNLVPAGFGAHTNASAYFASFQSDLPLNSIVFNYTILINSSEVGNILGIFLTITRTTISIQNIFGYDSGVRTKDYFSVPSRATNAGGIISFGESIYFREMIPENLFIGNAAMIDFDLRLVVLGSFSDIPYEYNSPVFITVNRPPGEC